MEKTIIPASPKRVLHALSNVGYSTQASICDIIDNSISHGQAKKIYVHFDYNDNLKEFEFFIFDDGDGMSSSELQEAMKIGSTDENYRTEGELGAYGFGLKTASLAHTNKLILFSKQNNNLDSIMLDKNIINEHDKWLYLLLNKQESKQNIENAKSILYNKYSIKLNSLSSFTLIEWHDIFGLNKKYNNYATSNNAKKWLQKEIVKIGNHIRMIFHRFLNHENGAKKIQIWYNGKKLKGWDPMRPKISTLYKQSNQKKEYLEFNGKDDSLENPIKIHRYILPKKEKISDPTERDNLWIINESLVGKDMRIDRGQGLYFYRNNRLIDYGGWYDGTGTEPHITYARASIDLDNSHNDLFKLKFNKTEIKIIDSYFKDFLRICMPKFKSQAKLHYSKNTVKKIKNKVRSKKDKVDIIIENEKEKLSIEVTEKKDTGGKEFVEVSNTYGKFFDKEIKSLKNSNVLKERIIAEELGDNQLLWKVTPQAENLMLIRINKLNELYKKYYLDDKHENAKTTALIDAFLLSISFTEIHLKTEENKHIFEELNRTIGNLLNKLIDNEII